MPTVSMLVKVLPLPLLAPPALAQPWDSFVAPAATPRPVITRLHTETARLLHTADVREALRKMGYEPTGSSPEALGRFLRDETTLWSKVIREAKIRID